MRKQAESMNISILHPDLGIGGAERLIVDIALALKQKGHIVQLITSHHNTGHCFPETRDGTFKVHVVGSWIPRSVFGKCHALFAYLRMLYAALYIIFNIPTDLVICDQISVCIPVFKLKRLKVLYYCHYPDLLLTDRKTLVKTLYRCVLDWLEEKTTGMADTIVVNSYFTANMFRRTFKSLENVKLEVVHPTIGTSLSASSSQEQDGDKTVFLSLNRFERKKNVELAVHAMHMLKNLMPCDVKKECELIIAGGYDDRLLENKEYFLTLVKLVESLGLESEVTLIKSPTDDEKQKLFQISSAVLYTPENEHFGIVPLEAMFFHKPVIACNSGGPLETVVDGITGYLCEPTAEAFSEKMKHIACNRQLAEELGHAGADHVNKNFSFMSFVENVNRVVCDVN